MSSFSFLSSSAPWAVPVLFLAAGFAVGFIVQKLVLARLKRLAAKTRWEGDEILIHSLHGVMAAWGAIAGGFVALSVADVSPGIENILQKTLLAAAFLSVTFAATKAAGRFAALWSRVSEGTAPATSLFSNLARGAVVALGLLMLLQALGLSITPLLTALGIGGLAVALALQPTLSNLFAGLQVLASNQLRPGDYVKLESGEEGYVVDVTWRNTTIRQLPNNIVVVPNAKLADTIVTNYYQPEREMAVLVQVGVAYGSDLDKVERVTVEVGREVMQEVEGGVPAHEPFIRYHTFGESSINFSVILRTQEFVGQFLVKHEFVKRLHRRYAQEGITIPFPQRDVHLEQK